MLAQSFLSAADLGIPDDVKDALIKTLVLLETGKLKHISSVDALNFSTINAAKFTGDFNMSAWVIPHSCGTVCCIGGTASLISGVDIDEEMTPSLNELFYPFALGVDAWPSITPVQAATALRSYLTMGKANWREAVAT